MWWLELSGWRNLWFLQLGQRPLRKDDGRADQEAGCAGNDAARCMVPLGSVVDLVSGTLAGDGLLMGGALSKTSGGGETR